MLFEFSSSYFPSSLLYTFLTFNLSYAIYSKAYLSIRAHNHFSHLLKRISLWWNSNERKRRKKNQTTYEWNMETVAVKSTCWLGLTSYWNRNKYDINVCHWSCKADSFFFFFYSFALLFFFIARNFSILICTGI